MADWKERAQITGDVVFFSYNRPEFNSTFDEVFVWDLDKTYLDSSWGSLSELLKTALEKAFQKRNVPGTGSLVRALKDSWSEKRETEKPFPIFFITASPPQMESKIREKFELDEILPLGCFCKDNFKNLRPSRFWRLTQQVGYKIQALLTLRRSLSEGVKQVLWGDDSESDATIYSLYSDICARRWSELELVRILRGLRVPTEQVDAILTLQDDIPVCDPVEKIYINLAADTDPEYYVKFGRRMVPTYNTFQVAIDLFQDGRLSPEQTVRVASDMVTNYGFSPEELAGAIENLLRRKLLRVDTFASLLQPLSENRLISPDFLPTPEVLRQAKEHEGDEIVNSEPWIPEEIDYLHEFR